MVRDWANTTLEDGKYNNSYQSHNLILDGDGLRIEHSANIYTLASSYLQHTKKYT